MSSLTSRDLIKSRDNKLLKMAGCEVPYKQVTSFGFIAKGENQMPLKFSPNIESHLSCARLQFSYADSEFKSPLLSS